MRELYSAQYVCALAQVEACTVTIRKDGEIHLDEDGGPSADLRTLFALTRASIVGALGLLVPTELPRFRRPGCSLAGAVMWRLGAVPS